MRITRKGDAAGCVATDDAKRRETTHCVDFCGGGHEIETQHRSRTGALLAHAYELIDRGPELEPDVLEQMICEGAVDLLDADAAYLWMIDDDGLPHHDRFSGGRPTATGIAVERALVQLHSRVAANR